MFPMHSQNLQCGRQIINKYLHHTDIRYVTWRQSRKCHIWKSPETSFSLDLLRKENQERSSEEVARDAEKDSDKNRVIEWILVAWYWGLDKRTSCQGKWGNVAEMEEFYVLIEVVVTYLYAVVKIHLKSLNFIACKLFLIKAWCGGTTELLKTFPF